MKAFSNIVWADMSDKTWLELCKDISDNALSDIKVYLHHIRETGEVTEKVYIEVREKVYFGVNGVKNIIRNNIHERF